MTSRLLLIQTITVLVYAGCDYFIHFQMRGSYANLFLISLLGSICLISLGLLVSARLSSEELAGGVLNLITWPMMMLSGVWFSLEGTNPLVQKIARFLPLTHIVDSARADHDRRRRPRGNRPAPRNARDHDRGLPLDRVVYFPMGIKELNFVPHLSTGTSASACAPHTLHRTS